MFEVDTVSLLLFLLDSLLTHWLLNNPWIEPKSQNISVAGDIDITQLHNLHIITKIPF